MNWIVAALVSALCLGGYDLCTKHAVRDNAVFPVLFLANLCSATLWLGCIAIQRLHPGTLPALLTVPPLDSGQHLRIVVKSLIVACAWTCTYFAVKHLSVSLAAPVRATSPIYTLVGAMILLGERPTTLQIVGIVLAIASLVLLSAAGKKEGVHFRRDQWVAWLFAGTALNSCSALYDKFLLGRLGFAPSTVQCWFVVYLALFFLPLAAGWKWHWWTRQEFHWRWSIPLLSLSLLAADFVYFSALRNPSALISVVATLRGGSTLVAFVGGLVLFHEPANRAKFLAAAGILAGIFLTILFGRSH
jgi:drug/metabolite transporter (DMT)-like permease